MYCTVVGGEFLMAFGRVSSLWIFRKGEGTHGLRDSSRLLLRTKGTVSFETNLSENNKSKHTRTKQRCPERDRDRGSHC